MSLLIPSWSFARFFPSEELDELGGVEELHVLRLAGDGYETASSW